MRHGCLSRNVKGTFIGICESHRGITILSLSKRQRETEREREREVSLTINRRLKVGKHNAMSGHTERGREGDRERFGSNRVSAALRRLYTRHKPRTSSHLPLLSKRERQRDSLSLSKRKREKERERERERERSFIDNQEVNPWTARPCVCVFVCVCARARACVGSIGRRYRG